MIWYINIMNYFLYVHNIYKRYDTNGIVDLNK